MTENESIKKHIEECEHRIGNILGFMESNSDADATSCEENISVLKAVIIALEELLYYRAICTVDELKALKEYKAKMEMQYLDDINNPLEPLKLSSALQSEIRKYEYRKEHKPQDISLLDYTIMYALKHCLEEQT